MPKLYPVTNRDFKLPENGWIHISPKGEFPHPTGITQVIDDAACTAMVNRFNVEAQEENFPGLLLDWDHFSNDSKAPSAAAGWIEALENRTDGLWAKIRWTGKGKESVEGGDYRLTSPVWNRSECEDLGGNRFRPQRLDRCALTNDPVLKGMAPISNRSTGLPDLPEIQALVNRMVQEALENAGTSAGAHKGWETRRGKLASFHATQAKMFRGIGKPGEHMAAKHEALAAKYAEAKDKHAVNHGLEKDRTAHINTELSKLQIPKKPRAKKAKATALKITLPPRPKAGGQVIESSSTDYSRSMAEKLKRFGSQKV